MTWMPQLLLIFIALSLLSFCLRAGFDASWFWTFAPFWIPAGLVGAAFLAVKLLNLVLKLLDFDPS